MGILSYYEESYYEDFETNNLPKGKKEKSGDTHSNYFSAFLKNNTENNNNDPVVGQKRPITKNGGGNNTLAKTSVLSEFSQGHADIEVDLEIYMENY